MNRLAANGISFTKNTLLILVVTSQHPRWFDFFPKFEVLKLMIYGILKGARGGVEGKGVEIPVF